MLCALALSLVARSARASDAGAPVAGSGWRSVLGTVAAGDPAGADRDYHEGVARLRAGDTAAAVDRLRVAAAKNPASAAIAEELGVGLARLGARREAEAAYRRAIELDPRRSAAYVNLAELLSGSPERWQRRDEVLARLGGGLTALADDIRGRQALGVAVARFEASVGQLGEARRRLQALLGEALPLSLHKVARDRLAAIDEEERARSLSDWPEPELSAQDRSALQGALQAAERALAAGSAGGGAGRAGAGSWSATRGQPTPAFCGRGPWPPWAGTTRPSRSWRCWCSSAPRTPGPGGC